MKTLTKGYCIENDITDPTPWEKESESEKVCECFLCGEDIFDTDRVHYIDGLEEVPICDHCFGFKKFTPSNLLDMLGIDVSRSTGRCYNLRIRHERKRA